jgi:hypothetical protein
MARRVGMWHSGPNVIAAKRTPCPQEINPEGKLPHGVSFADVLQHTSQQLEREETRINSRITWALAFQGFLFLSSATILSQDAVDKVSRQRFVYVVAAVGLFVASISLLGIHAAYSSIRRIKSKWCAVEQLCEEAPWFARPFGDDRQHRLGLLPSYTVPIAIIIAWVAMFIVVRWHFR